MRWINDAAPMTQALQPPESRVAGLAACLAILELEARALGHPLVALLLGAAGEELRQQPGMAQLSEPAGPRPG